MWPRLYITTSLSFTPVWRVRDTGFDPMLSEWATNAGVDSKLDVQHRQSFKAGNAPFSRPLGRQVRTDETGNRDVTCPSTSDRSIDSTACFVMPLIACWREA